MPYPSNVDAGRQPVSNAGMQGLTLSLSSLTANANNQITFSGISTVARLIRIQNEHATTIYWKVNATASTGSASVVGPAANSVSVEWISAEVTTLNIWVPTGGPTTLNASGGVKISAWA